MIPGKADPRRKLKVNGELGLLSALISLGGGIAFIIKADLGMTVVQAPVYVLSEAVPAVSIGLWNTIVQGSLFALMLIIVKRFKPSYLFSFLSALIYGFVLDFFQWLLKGVNAGGLGIQIIYYITGFALTCIAVAIFFTCKAPLMPYDIFLREIAEVKKISIPRFKWIFDISCVAVALILSLSLTGGIIGIGWGTLIFALLMSPLMAQLIKLINKYIEFKPLIK